MSSRAPPRRGDGVGLAQRGRRVDHAVVCLAYDLGDRVEQPIAGLVGRGPSEPALAGGPPAVGRRERVELPERERADRHSDVAAATARRS
jgi:hypothetical protein